MACWLLAILMLGGASVMIGMDVASVEASSVDPAGLPDCPAQQQPTPVGYIQIVCSNGAGFVANGRKAHYVSADVETTYPAGTVLAYYDTYTPEPGSGSGIDVWYKVGNEPSIWVASDDGGSTTIAIDYNSTTPPTGPASGSGCAGIIIPTFTPTASPTITPTPSNTLHPSITPTITLTPSPTPTPPPTCTIQLAFPSPFGSTELPIRRAPGLGKEQLHVIPFQNPAIQLEATQRYMDGNDVWYKVTYEDVTGWIAGHYQNKDNIVDPNNCASTIPVFSTTYPPGWEDISCIEQAEASGDPIDYLEQEPLALVMARVALAESAHELGESLFVEEAFYIAWLMRMRALIGYTNYVNGSAGNVNVSTHEEAIFNEIVAGDGAQFHPIDEYLNVINGNGIFTDNMVYGFCPRDVDVFATQVLWETMNIIQEEVLDAPWSAYPDEIRGYDRFYGDFTSASVCVGISRPTGNFYPQSNPVYANHPPQENTILHHVEVNLDNRSVYGNCFEDSKVLDNFFLDNYADNSACAQVIEIPDAPFSIDPESGNGNYFLAVLPQQLGDCIQ